MGGGGGGEDPLAPPLDPPLLYTVIWLLFFIKNDSLLAKNMKIKQVICMEMYHQYRGHELKTP